MLVAPTITCHPSFTHYTQCRDLCLWHLLLPVILLFIHYTQCRNRCLWHPLLPVIILFTTIHNVMIHVCGSYYYLSTFCLSIILSVVIHVCGTYCYLSSFCLSIKLSVVIHVLANITTCHPSVYPLSSMS